MHRNTCARTRSALRQDRSHLQIHRLHAAERALDLGQVLVCRHRLLGVEQLRLDVGAHDVEPVQFFLGRDLVQVTRE